MAQDARPGWTEDPRRGRARSGSKAEATDWLRSNRLNESPPVEPGGFSLKTAVGTPALQPECGRGGAGRRDASATTMLKKGLTILFLCEIMMAGFDSELARGGAECGMRSAECGMRKAESRRRKAEGGVRASPNAGRPAVQTNRDQAGSFSPAYHLLLQVTVCQRRMFLRINALHGKKMRRAVIPLARNR